MLEMDVEALQFQRSFHGMLRNSQKKKEKPVASALFSSRCFVMEKNLCV